MNKARILLCAAALLAACSSAPVNERPFASAAELLEVQAVLKRDIRARGSAAMTRLEADAVQQACNLNGNEPPEALRKTLEAGQMAAIKFPAGSLMGDWKRGEDIAQSGRGMTFSDAAGTPNGGSCYNCHQMAAK